MYMHDAKWRSGLFFKQTTSRQYMLTINISMLTASVGIAG